MVTDPKLRTRTGRVRAPPLGQSTHLRGLLHLAPYIFSPARDAPRPRKERRHACGRTRVAARIRGTEIKVHLTFLLLLAWFGWSAYREAGAAAAVADVVFFLAFFCPFCPRVRAHHNGGPLRRSHAGRHPAPHRRRRRLERIPEEPRRSSHRPGRPGGYLAILLLAAVAWAAGEPAMPPDPCGPAPSWCGCWSPTDSCCCST